MKNIQLIGGPKDGATVEVENWMETIDFPQPPPLAQVRMCYHNSKPRNETLKRIRYVIKGDRAYLS